MKWVVIASFIMYLATFSEGNALRCLQGIKNGCLIENADKVKKSHAECLSGSEWESSCHKCRCSDLGHAECTLLDACEKGEYEEHMVCKPNTKFYRDCNICRCLENGKGSYCTEKACLDLDQSVQSSELQEGLDCLPGSKWVTQCNNCTCSPEGYPTCTERLCQGQENEIKFSCSPHTSWKIECNNCSCAPNGKAFCTRMGCHMFDVPDFTPEFDDAEKSEKESDHKLVNHNIVKRSRICKANALIKVNCNFCKCALNGESYSCTLNECLEQDQEDIDLGGDNVDNAAHNIGDVEVFMDNEGTDHIERHSVCKPRGIFRIGCNTCLCNIDGTDFTCTNQPCPLPDDVEIFHELKDLTPIIP